MARRRNPKTSKRSQLVLESLEQRIALHGDGVNEFDVLIFSKTSGFRHGSIQAGIDAVEQLGIDNGFHTTATEDAGQFTDAGLAEFEAVVFMNTTGDVLNSSQQAAFERFIQSGKGYVGVHAAADTEYGWSWYGDLVGAYFQSHPSIQTATVSFEDRAHPATKDLPERWTVRDEWYNYRINPRGDVHVLATLDEDTYNGGNMGYDHPIAWAHDYDGGRAFYTGLGHVNEIFDTPEMQEHLLGGIEFAAGREPGDVGATIKSNFRKVTLDDQTFDPMELDVSDDGDVFYAERGGRVKVYDPVSDSTSTVGSVSVTQGGEDGLLGLALDPNFSENGHLFVYYSTTDSPVNRLSRFTVDDSHRFVGGSEEILLEVPTTNQCCHSGGSLQFGPDGSLYISTGDQTNPFASAGYAPIDEQPGREIWDAQRTSANTDELRGKILRIQPEPDGSYSIPDGNLFPADGSQGRPEIFVMGNRNPFRISIDQETGWLYWGEVGPDASNNNAQRGPRGYDEINQAREAGNFGWPYFIGDNQAYRDWNFSGGPHGPFFDPANPQNDSPNNTGSTNLPPAQPAMIWYPYASSTEFPEVGGGGRTAMAGPVYHYDATLESDVKLPEYFDNTLFIYEWVRGWIQEVKLDESGNILGINPMFEGLSRPMDMEIGPDGAIYLLEWGNNFGGGNSDSLLSRIEYTGGPAVQATAIIDVDADNGSLPLTVEFSGARSAASSGAALTYAWDFDGDGTTDSTDVTASYTYQDVGEYPARLTVTDATNGQSDSTVVSIFAGNNRPAINFVTPPEGQFFDWTDTIQYEVTVTDTEDGVNPSTTNLEIQPLLGHDDHAHPQDIFNSFKGSFVSPEAGHGGSSADLFLAIEARYTDDGALGVDSLTAIEQRVLQVRQQEAEYADQISGLEFTPDGRRLTSIDAGDYFSIDPVYLGDITKMRYRIFNANGGGQIELRKDAPDGPLIESHPINVAGTTVLDADVASAFTDSHELFFVFAGTPAELSGLQIDWVYFSTDGTDLPDPPDPGDMEVLYRLNTASGTVAAVDGGLDWMSDLGSPYLVEAGSNGLSGFSIESVHASVDQSTTPLEIFNSERWEAPGGPEMQYSFPVDQPGDYEVRLYMVNGWPGTSQVGQRVFSVSVEEVVPPEYTDIDLVEAFGHRVAGMISHTVQVSDGSLDLEFLHNIENPLINGIEIVRLGAPQPTNSPPTASAFTDTTNEDAGVYSINLLAASSASDPDGGDNLSITEITQSGGTAIQFSQVGNALEFDTDQFNGLATGESETVAFNFTVQDDSGADNDSVSATASITIAGRDESPLDGPVLYRLNTAGPSASAIDGGLDWSTDIDAPYLIEPGSNGQSGFPIDAIDSSVDTETTPPEIFLTERWEQSGGVEMQYSFPIEEPGDYEVRLYMVNGWAGTSEVGERIFSVSVENDVPPQYAEIDLVDLFGHRVAGMISHTVEVTDGALDLEFLHAVENPLINGIEILRVDDANQIPADFDQDGDVDTADRTILTQFWTGALAAGQGDRTFEQGDADGDGDVDSADQTLLTQNWTGARTATVTTTPVESNATLADELFAHDELLPELFEDEEQPLTSFYLP